MSVNVALEGTINHHGRNSHEMNQKLIFFKIVFYSFDVVKL